MTGNQWRYRTGLHSTFPLFHTLAFAEPSECSAPTQHKKVLIEAFEISLLASHSATFASPRESAHYVTRGEGLKSYARVLFPLPGELINAEGIECFGDNGETASGQI